VATCEDGAEAFFVGLPGFAMPKVCSDEVESFIDRGFLDSDADAVTSSSSSSQLNSSSASIVPEFDIKYLEGIYVMYQYLGAALYVSLPPSRLDKLGIDSVSKKFR
jgi:hypothetical protein